MRSEDEIIELLRRRFPPGKVQVGIGDDAAVFGDLVFTSDMLVEGTHFLREHPPFFLGRKSVNVNLSDLAAMGAEPLFILMDLALPRRLTSSWLDEFLNGVESACCEAGCSLVGGDISSSESLFVSVAAVGRAEAPVLRGKARKGEGIYLVGDLGLSRAGREAIEEKLEGFQTLKRAFWDPKPRLEEGKRVAKFASSMIDVSDGFVLDLKKLLQDKGALLFAEKFPIHPELREYCRLKGSSPLDYVLYGGEDYALVYTAERGVGPGVMVGKVTGDGVIRLDGKVLSVKGFSHFMENSG